ncbi:MAG: hypothetical protein AAF988_00185 [Pseudomonadota bacterium]
MEIFQKDIDVKTDEGLKLDIAFEDCASSDRILAEFSLREQTSRPGVVFLDDEPEADAVSVDIYRSKVSVILSSLPRELCCMGIQSRSVKYTFYFSSKAEALNDIEALEIIDVTDDMKKRAGLNKAP